MGGYIVLVHTDTIEDAKKVMEENHPVGGPFGRSVVGIWKLPDDDTATCYGYCTRGTAGWGRAKAGYLIHTCGKRPTWAVPLKTLAGGLFDRLGKNLLARRLTREEFQNPQGY